MNTQKYQWLFYLITATIIATIGVQFYWNYKNYEENKRQVTNEIQLSLDNAVEEYYSSLAKSDFLTIIDNNSNSVAIFKNPLNLIKEKSYKSKSIGNIINKIKPNNSEKEKPRASINNLKFTFDENLSKEKIDSMMISAKDFVIEFNSNLDSLNNKKKDSVEVLNQITDKKKGFNLNSDGANKVLKYFRGKKAADSLKLIKNLKPIFISFLDQSVEYEKIDSLIEIQLQKKGIELTTSFHHLKNDTLFHQTKDSLLATEKKYLRSKSTFVKDNEAFKLVYNNPSIVALKRSSFGIFLSLLLSLAVISSLFYLLKIINQQKELAAIKNDLISNITHEFKTPIATISAAIEAIKNFNVLEDPEKTNKYLSMSSIQINKLHQMVEKLLETAMLDSEQLVLKKETVDIVDIAEKVISKHQILAHKKELSFSTTLQSYYANIDVFHFENVISNLIDNAVKYGGNQIEININLVLKAIEITVVDDGKGIEKNQKEKIFDKFYRVPKGNTHDVKGFGIGLYYCKKIIEKHEGFIGLTSDKSKTIFKITIPNE
ncbi:MAG: HAMP domain-containing sensor histidine kinase [Polaribacter sp.]|jgi:signal transduction histidine kinase|uniref:sensor histidine kinase n=1 Tax=uncultured Polaribacter sp. TaxID=174711 RepID=UPI0030D96A24